MEYRSYKETDDRISLLGLGLMRLPHAEGDDANILYDGAKAIVDACYKGGVNYFDTAYGYHGGNSEDFAKKALAEYPRDSYYLASKLPMWLIHSVEDAHRIFAEQLERCGTEYFDFYLFHSLNAEHFATVEKLGLWDVIEGKRKEGKIKRIGFSFHDTPEVLEKICAAHPWDFAQIQLNYVDWEFQDAKGQYEILERNGIPCVVMEPVRGGRLADLGPKSNAMLQARAPEKSVASWAMRWVAQLPNVLCVLSGMSTLEQAQDNMATMGSPQPLDEADKAALQQAVEEFRSHALVPCTACQYCMPCPAGVHIPDLFALYNKCIFDGNNFGFNEQYKEFPEAGKAEHCIACGQCEGKCPQHIGIIRMMEQINEKAGS